MLAMSTSDHVEVDSALQDMRGRHPRAAAIFEQLYAPHRAIARGKLLTTGEVAAILEVTPQTVRNWVDAGWLPSRRRSRFGRRLIEASAIGEVAKFRSARQRLAAARPSISEGQAAEALRAHRAADRASTKVGSGPR